MFLLSWLARALLYRRLFGGGRRGGYGYGRRSRGGVFPFPHYSTRTRGGSRVTVSGCCLPIPLMLFLSALASARELLRR